MKRLITILSLVGSMHIIMFLPSCDYGYFEPIVINIPDTVSFSRDILPIFSSSCVESGCHVTGGIAPDLTDQNAYSDLWIYGMVDTSDAESSILFNRMSSTSNPMPPNGTLTNDKIQLVLAWIKQGALDN